MLQLEKRHWDIIKQILSKYPYQFYVFGSRVKNSAKKFSDLDLCYKEPISDAIISKIEGELEDSDLPFKVDFVDWNRCSPEFQKKIEKEAVVFKLSE